MRFIRNTALALLAFLAVGSFRPRSASAQVCWECQSRLGDPGVYCASMVYEGSEYCYQWVDQGGIMNCDDTGIPCDWEEVALTPEGGFVTTFGGLGSTPRAAFAVFATCARADKLLSNRARQEGGTGERADNDSPSDVSTIDRR